MLTICIFLSACGEVLGESKNVKSTAEYKLKKSMEVQNTEAAREAIAEGADVNMFHNKKYWDKVDKGQSESNPVRIAMFNGCYQVAEILLENGADANYEDSRGVSLLQAASNKDEQFIKVLIEHGADVNGINNGEPLSVAARKGYIDIVRYLIDNGANVNGNNIFSDGSGGESVLMYAIKGGQMECVKMLIEHGEDITYKYNGENAIDVAKASPPDNVYWSLCSIGG